MGRLPAAAVFLWEMFGHHGGAGHDEVNPLREDPGEKFRCYGSGVSREACVPSYSGLGGEEEGVSFVEPGESVGCGNMGVWVDIGPGI
jgi:hypothetical protein